MAAHSPAEVQWSTLPAECLVAMHWHCSEEFLEFLRLYGFMPIITTRHPLDVLISILQFSPHEPATAKWLEGEGGDECILYDADPTSREFLAYAVSGRAAALLAVSMEWRRHAAAVIRYEELVADPVRVLSGVIAKVSKQARESLEDVVASHTLEKLRPRGPRHFWRGEPGLWRTLITAEFQEAIWQRHQHVFEAFNYHCDSAAAPSAESARERWRILTDRRVFTARADARTDTIGRQRA
jgi:hypothetical protein